MIECNVCGGLGPEDFSRPIDHNGLCRIGRARRNREDSQNPVGVPGLFSSKPPPEVVVKKRRQSLDLCR